MATTNFGILDEALGPYMLCADFSFSNGLGGISINPNITDYISFDEYKRIFITSAKATGFVVDNATNAIIHIESLDCDIHASFGPDQQPWPNAASIVASDNLGNNPFLHVGCELNEVDTECGFGIMSTGGSFQLSVSATAHLSAVPPASTFVLIITLKGYLYKQ
jgi:hypothetical protein